MAVVSGGTTLIDNGALDSAVPIGKLVLLSTQTASASATIDFTSGIDSTYDSYVFKFINIHPANNSVLFQFQADTGTNTSYNQTITSTNFRANHDEADTSTALTYRTGRDLAQSTSFQSISEGLRNDNDGNFSGTLQIFNPSSSVFVKHFISVGNGMINVADCQVTYSAGYFNQTTPLTRFRFKMNSGNIDDGIIKMYGVK